MNKPRTQLSKRSLNTGCAILVLLLLGIGGLLLLIAQYFAIPQYGGLHNGDTVKIETARGEHIFLEIDIPGGAAVDWAAPDGLSLVFSDSSLAPVQIIPPTPVDWGDTVTNFSQAGTETAKLSNGVVVPQLPGPETRTIEGQITGTVVRPVPSSDGFVNEAVNIHISVQLELVSTERYSQLKNDIHWQFTGPRIIYFLILLVTICDILVLVFLVLIWLALGVFRKRLASDPDENVQEAQIKLRL